MRMCRSRPLKPRKYRLPWPRLPWSGQVGLWQKKDSMGRPDGSAMAQALGVSTRRGNTRVRGILWSLFARVGHHLNEQYPGYYGESCLYAHELVDPPIRLLWGAVDEIMVADLEPSLTFFGSLFPWLRRGHWPCGWEGEWPQGKLILW